MRTKQTLTYHVENISKDITSGDSFEGFVSRALARQAALGFRYVGSVEGISHSGDGTAVVCQELIFESR